MRGYVVVVIIGLVKSSERQRVIADTEPRLQLSLVQLCMTIYVTVHVCESLPSAHQYMGDLILLIINVHQLALNQGDAALAVLHETSKIITVGSE